MMLLLLSSSFNSPSVAHDERKRSLQLSATTANTTPSFYNDPFAAIKALHMCNLPTWKQHLCSSLLIPNLLQIYEDAPQEMTACKLLLPHKASLKLSPSLSLCAKAIPHDLTAMDVHVQCSSLHRLLFFSP